MATIAADALAPKSTAELRAEFGAQLGREVEVTHLVHYRQRIEGGRIWDEPIVRVTRGVLVSMSPAAGQRVHAYVYGSRPIIAIGNDHPLGGGTPIDIRSA